MMKHIILIGNWFVTNFMGKFLNKYIKLTYGYNVKNDIHNGSIAINFTF